MSLVEFLDAQASQDEMIVMDGQTHRLTETKSSTSPKSPRSPRSPRSSRSTTKTTQQQKQQKQQQQLGIRDY